MGIKELIKEEMEKDLVKEIKKNGEKREHVAEVRVEDKGNGKKGIDCKPTEEFVEEVGEKEADEEMSKIEINLVKQYFSQFDDKTEKDVMTPVEEEIDRQMEA